MTQTRVKMPIHKVHHFLSQASASALILTQGKEHELIVQSGDLSEKAFQTVQEALRRYWTPSIRDVNRYVGLNLDNGFYILYAKYLPQCECFLVLVFKSRIPLIRLRQDMTSLIRIILNDLTDVEDLQRPLERTLQFIQSTQQKDIPRKKDSEIMADWIYPNVQTSEALDEADRGQQVIFNPLRDADVEISSLESQVDFEGNAENAPWQLIDFEHRNDGCSREDGKSVAKDKHAWQPLNEIRAEGDDLASILQGDFELRDDISGLNEWMIPGEISYEDRSQEVFEQSRNSLVQDNAGDEAADEMIKVSDVVVYLAPRSKEHRLLGALDYELRTWMPQICAYYGWGLSSLSVRADYLQMTLKDFPDILIPDMLQIIRKQTSERIFSAFPKLREALVSEDFWAPGYLVDNQQKEYSTQEVLAVIAPGRRSHQR